MNENILELKNIYKCYGKNNSKVNAVNGIDLMVKRNEFTAIVGPSGSGKTTLFNIIGLLENETSGYYYLHNNDISNVSSKKKAEIRNQYFGFVFQNYALINKYTVYENIKLPIIYSKKKYNKLYINDKIDNIINKLGIYDKKNEIVSNLSGGQRQRVSIARALINNPEIILADEPTGALDVKTSEQIMNIFEEMHNIGKTILLITHNLEIANRCSKIIKIEDGKIVEVKEK